MWLLFLFIAVPVIEIALFIQVGGLIGLFPTLAIVIFTAILGTYLVRGQGLSTLSTLQSQFSNGWRTVSSTHTPPRRNSV